MVKNILIVGSSGHAKVAIDIIEKENKYHIVGLIDPFRQRDETTFGYKIFGAEENIPALMNQYSIYGGFIAVGDNWKRFLVATKIMNLLPEFTFINAIHPSAQIARGVTIGRGTVLMAGTIVNSDCKIGNFCILNTKASLDHDSVMEDYSSLAPGSTTGGYVSIGAFSAISTGVSIARRCCVGKHTVIGIGSAVTKDIPSFCVAYGVPAKVVRNRKEGDDYL